MRSGPFMPGSSATIGTGVQQHEGVYADSTAEESSIYQCHLISSQGGEIRQTGRIRIANP